MTTPGGDDLAALEHAIDTLEAQRPLLGDAVVDTALVPLQERRSLLRRQVATEQRKLVTVVFADLVSFTDLSGRLDPEDTRNIVDAYFGRWRAAIEAHGGVVEKFIGDAVMAVFGLRQSWEDDAQRAVRAALAMVADLADLNVEMHRRYGVTLRMRVGIDTGDVVVSALANRLGDEPTDGDFIAVGPSVNRAARLEAAAPPDRILVSAQTQRHLRNRFSMQRIDGLELKGFEGPVTGYLAVSERPHGFRLDRSGGVEGVETSTVGREVELRFLQERLEDVLDEGRWRVVTVVGDAGVGKSRLLLDFDAWLGELETQVYWFRGRASPADHSRAHSLLRDVLGARMGISDSDDAPELRAKLEAGFARSYDGTGNGPTTGPTNGPTNGPPSGDGDDPQRAVVAAHLVGGWLGFDLGFDLDDAPTWMPRDPQALRDAGTRELSDYFARLARMHPVVVLLEDLHWADDGSLRWLDQADQVLRDVPVLVVATSRPSLLEQRPRWSEGLLHHVRLFLDPLSRRQSRRLLRQILRYVDDPPDSLVDLVIESADGNPFYIEELVTWLIDAGVVVKGTPRWHVVEELVGTVVVPSTLRGVLQARLDALTAPERALLQRASVVGRVFWDEAVQRLAPRPAATEETLDDLRRRELVFEREESVFDSAREFLFKHALLRDVAYDGVLRAHRERYHRLAGDWLAEVSARSGREEEYAALIAEHFDRAHEPQAARWYFRAGRQAAAVYALDEATRLLARALDLEEDPVRRFEVLLLRESVLDRCGDREAQRQDLSEMERLDGRLGPDPARRFALQLARSRLAFAVSDYDEAEQWADAALVTATEGALPAEEAEAQLWRGKSLTWREDQLAAADSLSRALEGGRTHGTAQQVAESLRYLSILANNEGRYPDAFELSSQAAASFRSVGDLEGEALALSQGSSTLYLMGRLAEARATLERTLEIFQRSGHRYRVAVVLGNLASIALSEGRLSQALTWALEAVEETRVLADREATATDLVVLSMIATELGWWEQGERYSAEALEIGRELVSAGIESDAWTRLCVLRLQQGDLEGARVASREALACSEQVASPMDRAHALLGEGYATFECGDLAAADAAFRCAAEVFGELDVAIGRREALAGQARTALAQGDAAGAVRLLEEVLPHLGRSGLDGTVRLAAMLENCWRVVAEAGDPRAADTLRAGQAYLRGTADLITDPEQRAGFLAVPVNAALLAARPEPAPPTD